MNVFLLLSREGDLNNGKRRLDWGSDYMGYTSVHGRKWMAVIKMRLGSPVYIHLFRNLVMLVQREGTISCYSEVGYSGLVFSLQMYCYKLTRSTQVVNQAVPTHSFTVVLGKSFFDLKLRYSELE